MIALLITATIILWLHFAITVNVVERYQKNQYTGIREWLSYANFYFFLIHDVVFNYTLGTVWFLELASNERKTLTERLKYILHKRVDRYNDETHKLESVYLYSRDSWRYWLARQMCLKLIEPIHWNHCGLDA